MTACRDTGEERGRHDTGNQRRLNSKFLGVLDFDVKGMARLQTSAAGAASIRQPVALPDAAMDALVSKIRAVRSEAQRKTRDDRRHALPSRQFQWLV